MAQAVYAAEHFTGQKLPEAVIADTHRKLKRDLSNVAIIGMPGCGKSTIGRALAKTLGQVWQRHPAQGLYAITADADFEQHFGKKAARRRKIYNGMIPCQLYMYFEQPKREKR